MTWPPSLPAAARVAKQLSGGIGHLMKKNKVTVFMGMATAADKGMVDGQDRQGHRDAERKVDHPCHRRARARPAGA